MSSLKPQTGVGICRGANFIVRQTIVEHFSLYQLIKIIDKNKLLFIVQTSIQNRTSLNVTVAVKIKIIDPPKDSEYTFDRRWVFFVM